jgi:uncharacterized protein (TIGR00730 family)
MSAPRDDSTLPVPTGDRASDAAPPASPYEMKQQDKEKSKLIPTVLAYENRSFIGGDSARIIRILCEFQEPQERLRQHDIRGTILFFGSARSMSREHYDETLRGMRDELSRVPAGDAAARAALQDKMARFQKVEWMCPYTVIIEDLARRLTQWSLSVPKLKKFFSHQPDYLTGTAQAATVSRQPLVVCTGGGPGIMEAANRGASSVPTALSMGMGISLPFEKGLNPFVTKSLAFEYHYFFTRKFWMMYTAKALIVGPGGFGTLDELFELLTLRQTGKLADIPIVLIGSHFWRTIINWQALADFGTVSQAETDRLFITDDAQSAFEHITANIEERADKFESSMNPVTPQLHAAAPATAAAGSPSPIDKI